MDNLTVGFLGQAVSLLKECKSSEKIGAVINQLRFKSLDFATCVPSKINPSQLCMYCGNVWHDGLFSFHVKGHKNNKIRKRMRKMDHTTTLSPCRKDFLTYYKSQKDNILVKKCLVCKSITKFSMSKPFNNVNKEMANLQLVENQNSESRKRKRKSGKKQSFAGLSPTAVLQARLSSVIVENSGLVTNEVPNICEPPDIKNVSRLIKNNSLASNNVENSDKNVPSTVSQGDVCLRIHLDSTKKQKLKNDGLRVITKKSSKKKKKSFLSDVLSFL